MQKWRQCEAVLFSDRRKAIPPRRCRRVAVEGEEYCEIHEGMAELQGLYRRCLKVGWEYMVGRWGG